MSLPRSLIGNVSERTSSLKPSAPCTNSHLPDGSRTTGFPSVQHRSKSAFAKAREAQRSHAHQAAGDAHVVPIVHPVASLPVLPQFTPLETLETLRTDDRAVQGYDEPDVDSSTADWRDQISAENERRVDAMTDFERQEAVAEIKARFGSNVGDILRKAKAARELEESRRTQGPSTSAVTEPGVSPFKFPLPQISSSLEPKKNDNSPKDNIDDHIPDSHIVPESGITQDWRHQISLDNERRVQAMSESEREDAVAEIVARFGSNVGDVLRKARASHEREGKRPGSNNVESSHHTTSPPPRGILITPPISRSSTPGRPDRKLRFADVTADDVYVYESQPPSPRRVLGLLPPPSPLDEEEEGNNLPVIQLKAVPLPKKKKAQRATEDAPSALSVSQSGHDVFVGAIDEGTPEDIRRRFFPNAPAHEPSLEWIEQASSPPAGGVASLRFDLFGTIIPVEQQDTLPTHLGLHHHGSTAAGYALDDLFLLSRSTVPAQRATMVGVLAKIVVKLARQAIPELRGKEEETRRRAMAAGLEAFDQRGSLGVQAIQLVFECIVSWDEEMSDVEGVELIVPTLDKPAVDIDVTSDPDTVSGQASSSADALATLPLSFILSQIATHFNNAALPVESQSQLLAILHRLARHSAEIAATIIKTPGVIASVMKAFVLTPIPPRESSPLPNPSAVHLLRVLALASRELAQALTEPTDALLRFVTTLPTESPFPLPLATSLIAATFDLYTTLASYGLYSHIATTAAPYLAALKSYILSDACTSRPLVRSWIGLLEAWMICARDPHQTTPPHDILWSQVVGWGWLEDLLAIRDRMGRNRGWADEGSWALLWRALATWLEGCRVNSVRSGQAEREVVVEVLKQGFGAGVEGALVGSAVVTLGDPTSVGLVIAGVRGDAHDCGVKMKLKASIDAVQCVQSMAQLILAATPHSTDSFDTSPWVDTVRQFHLLAADMLQHPGWSTPSPEAHSAIHYLRRRPVTSLLGTLAKLRRVNGSVGSTDWVCFSTGILERLLPGDEEVAQWILDETIKDIRAILGQTALPQNAEDFTSLAPFLSHAVRPTNDLYLGPYTPSPRSIQRATTRMLPSVYHLPQGKLFGLPLARDWPVTALDHLLRSGTSPVFQNLPAWWDASETDVVRSSLTLAATVRNTLMSGDRRGFAMSREQTILACMKVFMLEHGQRHDDSNEEVFRDNAVGELIAGLLEPFAFSAASNMRFITESLEDAAKGFLGPATPFYQFYTDFVGLYDAISFSHRWFALLLLPPTSMQYAPDYRKHLWGDYGHVLRALRMPTEQVLMDDIGTYLWPIERDPEMISWYLRALVKWPLEGFVRFVAIHHVACNIWPDLANHDRPDRAKKLLRAVIDQTKHGVVKDVLRYHQIAGGSYLFPPSCYHDLGGLAEERLGYIGQSGGEAVKERVEKILLCFD